VNGVRELEKLSISIPSPDHSGLGYGTSREFNREEIVRNPDRSGLSDGTNQFLNSIAQPFTYGFQYSLAQPFTNRNQASLAQPFTNSDQASLAQPFTNSDQASFAQPFTNSDQASLAQPFTNSDQASLAQPFTTLAQPFTAGRNRANLIMDGVYAIPESSDESVRMIPRSVGWWTSFTRGYSDLTNDQFQINPFNSVNQSFNSMERLFNSTDLFNNSLAQSFTTGLNRANPIMDGVYAIPESVSTTGTDDKNAVNGVADWFLSFIRPSHEWLGYKITQLSVIYLLVQPFTKRNQASIAQPFTTLAQPFTTGREIQLTMEQSK